MSNCRAVGHIAPKIPQVRSLEYLSAGVLGISHKQLKLPYTITLKTKAAATNTYTFGTSYSSTKGISKQ